MANQYSLQDFLQYQEVNNVLPQQLAQYCIEGYNNIKPDITIYSDILNDIISNITKGVNPNDILFRNTIKFLINTLNQNNYDDNLNKMKELDFDSVQNIHFLILELIRCAINCPISFKGYDFKTELYVDKPNNFVQETPSQITVPEVCVNIAKYFSTMPLTINNKPINIHNELLNICRHYFISFLDPTRLLDEHNTHSSDNYKGFMTFMGLLYSKNLIQPKILLDCINNIKNTIFMQSKTSLSKECQRSSFECNNFYKGYEFLIKHIINVLTLKFNELKVNSNNNDIYKNKLVNMKPNDFNNIDMILNKYKNEDIKYLLVMINIDINNISNDILHQKYNSFDELQNILQDVSINFNNVITKLLEYEIGKCNTNTNMIQDMFSKNAVFLDSLIGHHQEINLNNKIFKTFDSKKQLVNPLKNYTIMTHNLNGELLNKLHSSVCKCSTKYVN